jgi:hypothetical protein
MNPLVIALGVLLVAIILMTLYSNFFSGTTTMVDKVNLANAIADTATDKIDNPLSGNRTYSVWIYVNTWNNSTSNKMIFGREGDIVLFLDKATSKLRCLIKPVLNDMTAANGTAAFTTTADKIIDITNDFPIQKWVFVTVVIDSANIGDYYLDGKLVKSVKIESGTIVGANNPIKYGSGHDTWIAMVKRNPKITGPQEVWNMYAQSNPGSSMKDAIGNYNVNLSLLKDNAVSSSVSLF